MADPLITATFSFHDSLVLQDVLWVNLFFIIFHAALRIFVNIIDTFGFISLLYLGQLLLLYHFHKFFLFSGFVNFQCSVLKKLPFTLNHCPHLVYKIKINLN